MKIWLMAWNWDQYVCIHGCQPNLELVIHYYHLFTKNRDQPKHIYIGSVLRTGEEVFPEK